MGAIRWGAIVYVLWLLSGCATTDTAPVNTQIPLRGNVAVAHTALKLQGQPYRYGGQSPVEGFDCSGLVHYVYHQHGILLPRNTSALADALPAIAPAQRLPGDLLFFTIDSKPLSHVGIYVGNEQFVHAPSSRSGRVMVSSLRQDYWQQRFAAVRRPGRQLSAVQMQCLAPS